MLIQTAIFLAAAVLMVPLARRLGLGAVLGYLAAGAAIGPWGLKLIDDVEAILHFAEFGVVLFLFLIGLELQPSRLWVLRRQVFGLGGAQVLLCALALGGIALAFGQATTAALVAGLGLAMSSTAFVLQTLAEKNELTAGHGRDAFAILLFQDLAVIPILALLPSLGGQAASAADGNGWSHAFKAVAVIAALVLASRTVLRPAFKAIATLGSRETFTAAALLVVVGTTLLMEVVGLTASLGAFLAGVLLADSEYRHELEANIEPFKGLLLGLFFIAVGMSANIGLIGDNPALVLGLVLTLFTVKLALLWGLRRVTGASGRESRKLAIALAQGGEFAFVLFQMANSHKILSEGTADLLVVVVTVSMLLAPLLFILEEKLLAPSLDRNERRAYDHIDAHENPVVIAGYGRVGQIVSRVLTIKKIPFTALEISPAQVDFVRRFGNEIYYGDASRLDLLHAAKVGQAKIFVLAIDDVDASIKTAETVRRHFPHVPIYARARNRFHAYKLMDLGVKALIRETWHGSVELSEKVLLGLGMPLSEVSMTIAKFKTHDEDLLKRQHAVYLDEALLIQTAMQAREELKALFEQDQEDVRK